VARQRRRKHRQHSRKRLVCQPTVLPAARGWFLLLVCNCNIHLLEIYLPHCKVHFSSVSDTYTEAQLLNTGSVRALSTPPASLRHPAASRGFRNAALFPRPAHSQSHAGRNDLRLHVLSVHEKPLHHRSEEGEPEAALQVAEGTWKGSRIPRQAARFAHVLKSSQWPCSSTGQALALSLVPTTGHPSVLIQPLICDDSPLIPLLPCSVPTQEWHCHLH